MMAETRNRLSPGRRAPKAIDGAALLDRVESHLARFIAYPENARVAHVLWCAHVHLIENFECSPRLAFLSPEPGSGKSRSLEATETLLPRAVEAINVTPAYLFRKVGDPEGMPSILFDEIDTVFGPRAKDNEEIRGLLNAGHRRGAFAGRCVVKGKLIETEEIEAFCPVALAGLGNLPDTIISRSIVIHMQRRAPTEQVESFRRRIHVPEGNALRDQLAAWAESIGDGLADVFPQIPDGITDRDADKWEPLIVIADAAGGRWPERARVAAVALVADAKRETPSLGVKLLADLRTVFGEHDHLSTATILEKLQAIEESPWGDLKGKPLDARRMARLLGDYEIKSINVRIGDSTPKGYRRCDLVDAWNRYLGASPETSATSATAATAATDAGDWAPPGFE